jgi:hypothetical protein
LVPNGIVGFEVWKTAKQSLDRRSEIIPPAAT